MANIFDIGFESGTIAGEGLTQSYGGNETIVTAAARTGTLGWRQGTNSSGQHILRAFTGVLGRAYFSRFYYRRTSGTATSSVSVAGFSSPSGAPGRIIVNTSRQLYLIDNSNATLYTHATALTLNQWYMVELKAQVASSPTGANGILEMRIDGASVFSTSTANIGTTALSAALIGDAFSAANWAGVGDFDDWRTNDDQGASDNTFPGAPGGGGGTGFPLQLGLSLPGA
jgi:hypothetical protein